MNQLDLLPDTPLSTRGEVSRMFVRHGCDTFRMAAQYVRDLPYGYNSSDADSSLIFAENCGTCTTKHGIVARLAAEMGLPVKQAIGLYKLDSSVIPGLEDILSKYGLDFVPQVHCFLVYEGNRIDLTHGNAHGKKRSVTSFLKTVEVEPDLPEAEKKDLLRKLMSFAVCAVDGLEGYAVGTLLKAREECSDHHKAACSCWLGDSCSADAAA